jgi:predicted nucleic acid-binding protein
MILLDTNVVIAFFNGNKAVLKRIQAEIDRIALSTLVVAELDYGAKGISEGQRKSRKAV